MSAPNSQNTHPVKRSRRAFWPGYRWRVLAHGKETIGRKMDYPPAGRFEMRSENFKNPIEFDELVIDDWFHIEQMNERDYWIGVGNGDDYWHLNVRIDRDGKASVLVEKQ